MVTKSRSRGREDDLDLSREQNILFTRLERYALPIVQARHDAVKELGLVDVLHALDAELTLKHSLMPDPAVEAEYAQLERRWAELMNRLDSWILEELKRNRLLAYALRLPLTPSTVAMPVPSTLWHLLKLDVDQCSATCDDWSFVEIRVVFVTILTPRDRELVEDGLWKFGTWMTEELIETKRQEADLQGRPTSRHPVAQGLGASAANPLHVHIASIDETAVVKTETVRRNTRYGKEAPETSEALHQTGNPAGSDHVEVATEIKTVPPAPKKSGPRTLNPEINNHLEERSRLKQCRDTWREESTILHAWARRTFRKQIAAKERKLSEVKRLREVHADTYYRLNPEFDRRARFRQESIQAIESG
jgi:hypothetical protein